MKHIATLTAALALIGFAQSTHAQDNPQEAEPATTLFELDVAKAGGLAFDGELLWVSDRVGQKLRGLDPASGAQKKVLESPGPWPTGLAHDGKLLWVADKLRGRLFGVDTKAGLVVSELESPRNPLGLAFDGNHLWVADGKRIHQVSREDGTTIVTFNAPPWPGKGRGSEQLGLAFDDGRLWAADRKTDKIYEIDPERGAVIDLIASPGPFPAGLAFLEGKLLVADVENRSVEAIDLPALPRIVRSGQRRETVVLTRRITNRGPGVLTEAVVHVAIPKSAPNQALDGEPTFSPEPTEIVTDRWGQRFAIFRVTDLEPGESLDVSMTVSATLFAARHHVDPAKVGGLRSIPKAIRKQYLEDASKFELEHPSIDKHLQAALEGEKRPYWMVRKIAAYIGEQMEYELVGGWNIAPTVIDRGSGSCSEYTFVFIAMCRAAGIPARYVGAIVIRGDNASTDDVFHRWAEVYLPGYGWIPVDAQGADKPSTEKQGLGLGSLVNRFLITTWGGGASKYIGWYYNSDARWTCRGRCDVDDLHVADWYPRGKEPKTP